MVEDLLGESLTELVESEKTGGRKERGVELRVRDFGRGKGGNT